jgi:hypothetical protein
VTHHFIHHARNGFSFVFGPRVFLKGDSSFSNKRQFTERSGSVVTTFTSYSEGSGFKPRTSYRIYVSVAFGVL